MKTDCRAALTQCARVKNKHTEGRTDGQAETDGLTELSYCISTLHSDVQQDAFTVKIQTMKQTTALKMACFIWRESLCIRVRYRH